MKRGLLYITLCTANGTNENPLLMSGEILWQGKEKTWTEPCPHRERHPFGSDFPSPYHKEPFEKTCHAGSMGRNDHLTVADKTSGISFCREMTRGNK